MIIFFSNSIWSQTHSKSRQCVSYYGWGSTCIIIQPINSWGVVVVIAWYSSWIYDYLCNQCLSSPKLWVCIPIRQGVLDATLYDKVCQWLATGPWFSPGTSVSSTNKTDRHDITEILWKVTLNTINQPPIDQLYYSKFQFKLKLYEKEKVKIWDLVLFQPLLIKFIL